MTRWWKETEELRKRYVRGKVKEENFSRMYRRDLEERKESEKSNGRSGNN